MSTTWRSRPRAQPKWVVSRTLASVGPNATLVAGDLGAAIGDLKARLDGVIEVAGPALAQSLSDLGFIDEYRLYLHPRLFDIAVEAPKSRVPDIR